MLGLARTVRSSTWSRRYPYVKLSFCLGEPDLRLQSPKGREFKRHRVFFSHQSRFRRRGHHCSALDQQPKEMAYHTQNHRHAITDMHMRFSVLVRRSSPLQDHIQISPRAYLNMIKGIRREDTIWGVLTFLYPRKASVSSPCMSLHVAITNWRN